MSSTTGVSDVELIAGARGGDQGALTELYTRHQAAARRVARSYRRAGDPDDLVNEAFARVLGALERGAGPDDAFRAYLFVTLRRLAAEQIARASDEPVAEVPEPVRAGADSAGLDPAERQMVVAAYESLPDQWQSVLWQTAVEGRQPRELAAVLGISGNAASALAYRAREKLRQAYLQAHLQAEPRPDCEPHRSRLGAFVRDGLSRRDRTKTEAHLGDCGSCRGLLAELADVNGLLARSLFPMFTSASHLGAAAVAGGAAATGGAGAGVGAARRVLSKARSNPAAVAAAVVAVAALVAALAGRLIGDDSPARELVAPVENQAVPPDDEPEPPVAPTDQSAPTLPLPLATPQPPVDAPADEPLDDPLVSPDPAVEEPTPATAPPPAAPAVTAPLGTSPPPTGPPATAPPTTTTTTPPPDPGMGPVVWFPDTRQLQVTLANPGSARTDYLVLDVRLTGQAALDGSPSGCGLTLALRRSLVCGIDPIPPGGQVVVTVPLAVDRPGQKARVSLCAVGFLSLDCDTGILARTTKDLTIRS